MTTIETILLVALLISLGFNLRLCYLNDKKDIQIEHDEKWKMFADMKIKELEEELKNQTK